MSPQTGEALQPRIDKVSGTYELRFRCTRCGRKTQRTKTFRADTYTEVCKMADAWTPPKLCGPCRKAVDR